MKTGEVFAPYLLHKIIWSIGLFVCFHAHGQEICNNGKDDDGDGLVDLHDPDCQCHWNSNVNLLKNASFESYIKCEVEPYTNANDANVIDNWTYATFLYGNPNYYHNFSCHEDSAAMMYAMPPKLPLPDGGRAYVTISQDGSNLADAQEQRMNKYYLAQVLAAPLSKGVDYTLTFYAGKFHDRDDPNFFVDSFGVGIFGSTDTAVLPFGVPSQGNGCPANYAGWYALGKATLYSKGYWVEGRISFTPPANIRLFFNWARLFHHKAERQRDASGLQYFFFG